MPSTPGVSTIDAVDDAAPDEIDDVNGPAIAARSAKGRIAVDGHIGELTIQRDRDFVTINANRDCRGETAIGKRYDLQRMIALVDDDEFAGVAGRSTRNPTHEDCQNRPTRHESPQIFSVCRPSG